MSRKWAGNVANGLPESRLGGSLREMGIIILLAVMLSSGKAFNSDPLNQPLRTVFWIIVCTIIMGQIILFWRLFLARWLDRSMSLRIIGCCLAAVLSAALFGLELNLLKTLPISPVPPEPYLANFKWLLPPILIMGFAYAFYGRHPSYSEFVDTPQKSLTGPAKLLLLPGPVHFPDSQDWPTTPPDWIEAQDHYLRFGGLEGNAFLRGRIKDADNFYSGGLRVHRSWWVKKCAIAKIDKQGRRMTIIMKDGKEIPVSRRYQNTLSSPDSILGADN